MTHLQFLMHARVQRLWPNGCCLCVEPWSIHLQAYSMLHSFTCIVQWTQSKAHFLQMTQLNLQHCQQPYLHCQLHLSGAPLRGRCTLTPNGVRPNRPHLSFCSEPFGLEQCTLGIASVPQGTKQFIALNGERACSARRAETTQQQQQQPYLLNFSLPTEIWEHPTQHLFN